MNHMKKSARMVQIDFYGVVPPEECLREIHALLSEYGEVGAIAIEDAHESEAAPNDLNMSSEDMESEVRIMLMDNALVRNINTVVHLLKQSMDDTTQQILYYHEKLEYDAHSALDKEWIPVLHKRLSNASYITSNHIYLIEHIQEYLIDLPEGEGYERLRLQQSMIQSYLSADSLFESPRMIDSIIATEFTRYKSKYSAFYVSELEEYAGHIQDIYQKKKDLQSRLRALIVLSGVIYGPKEEKKAEELMQDFEAFWKDHAPFSYDKSTLLEVLDAEPEWNGFSLGTMAQTQWLKKLRKELSVRLEKCLKQVQISAMQEVLKHTEGSNVKRLLDIIHLSNLEEVVALIGQQENDEIIHTIRTILGK